MVIENLALLRERRILVTGHTGFKGLWLCNLLGVLGCKYVYGCSEPGSQTDDSLNTAKVFPIKEIYGDLADFSFTSNLLSTIRPDYVIHLAAQSLVRRSYAQPHKTVLDNVLATVNILEVIRVNDFKTTVLVTTTDKVYRNLGNETRPFAEDDPLGGFDPYSGSKAATDILAQTWGNIISMGKEDKGAVLVARAGNVIGGGDWAPDRLIPDCVRSIGAREDITLRNPKHTRPWQHVLEPIVGYLLFLLSARDITSIQGSRNVLNFGPIPGERCDVEWVSKTFNSMMGSRVAINVSDTGSDMKESVNLELDPSLALEALGWRPQLTVSESLQLTADWYLNAEKAPQGSILFTGVQIESYLQKLGFRI
jgi:CDP-glucose 4,6-dehydratase